MLRMVDLRWNLWEQLVHSSIMAYRKRLYGGWVFSGRERVYDCCSESLWEEQHPPHQHLPSESYISFHWASDLPRLLSLTLSPFRPPFLFLHLSLSVSLSHALYPIGSVTLATLSKKPACGKTEVGVLIVSLGKRDGVSIIIVFGAAWDCFFGCVE